jgi:wyosine [tRNA(Phe)-imidazoG37] synthetase (radical SAM superfamily)
MTDVARAFKYVFGPVPSRRLGLSLGCDLAPRKVCSYDCVYCQVGRTDRLTLARAPFVPVDELLSEIAAKLASGPRPDFITLSGSGEPTLNSALGEIMAGIRRTTDVRIAILTNGSTLVLPAVRAACAGADVVLPTFSAADEETFRAIHRPAPGVTLAGVVEGLAAFRREFRGQIWLEVFIIAGVNSDADHARRLAALIQRLDPDRVQLNTAVRPTADAGVRALTEEELKELARLLGPKAEVIADFKRPKAQGGGVKEADILDMVRRRPVTLQDIAAGLGISAADAAKCVEALLAAGRIRREERGGREYYRADVEPAQSTGAK